VLSEASEYVASCRWTQQTIQPQAEEPGLSEAEGTCIFSLGPELLSEQSTL
jgi:hypothetical protein